MVHATHPWAVSPYGAVVTTPDRVAHRTTTPEEAPMSQTSVATLIGSNKGGIGKSLLAQCLVLAHDGAGVPLKLAEIDYACKLRTVLGDRVDLSLDPGVTAQGSDISRRAIEGHFNDLYERIWMQGHSLTDLGANVTTPLLHWFQANDIGSLAEMDGIRFRFVAVASPDPQSLIATTDAVKHAREVLGDSAEVVVILNDTSGGEGFKPYNDVPCMLDLVRAARDGRCSIVNVPYCHSLVLEHAQAHNYDVLTMVNDLDRIMDEMSVSLSRIERHSHSRKMHAWAKSVEAALDGLFLRVDTTLSTPVQVAPVKDVVAAPRPAGVVPPPAARAPVRADAPSGETDGSKAPTSPEVRRPARVDVPSAKVNVMPPPAIDMDRLDADLDAADRPVTEVRKAS